MDDGTKTLRQYSKPLNLSSFVGYEIAEEDLWAIDEKLDKIKHYDIAPKSALAHLRPADNIERQAGKIVEYRKR